MIETKTQSTFSTILDGGEKRIAEIKSLQSKPVKTTKRNLVFGAMCLVSFLVLGAFAVQIISGIIALVVSVIVGLGLLYGYRYLKIADPLIQQKMRNHVLKKMIEEAKTNKIETLTNLVLTSNQRLDNVLTSISKMKGHVNKLSSKIDEGSSMYENQKKMLDSATSVVDTMKANYQKASTAHKVLEEKVQEYKAMHEFSTVFNEAMSFARQTNEQNLEEMLGYEAFNQIETDFHTAIADIETLDLQMKYEE